jgi:DNA repair photolyase
MSKEVKQVSGTAEWAVQNINVFSGCVHDCKYCYAKSMAVRFKRKTPENWKDEEVDCSRLHVVPKPKKEGGYTMFPSSHDMTPENFGYAVYTVNLLLEKGHHLLLVSKPHPFVIQKICRIFADKRDKILFRFTIGSSNSETLRFWEPNAPSFEERLS